jgi:hypothetical protein
MPESTDPKRGRRKLAERDREADAGERRDEYRDGQWSQPGDPADQRRREAVEANAETARDRDEDR